jgi:hypothetical protein
MHYVYVLRSLSLWTRTTFLRPSRALVSQGDIGFVVGVEEMDVERAPVSLEAGVLNRQEVGIPRDSL